MAIADRQASSNNHDQQNEMETSNGNRDEEEERSLKGAWAFLLRARENFNI